MFYDKLPDAHVRCQVCPRQCEVADGRRGWCGVRRNDKGTYKTLVYGKICSAHIDPIEKKPLYHYLPGTTALSVATAGCNFECKFCQNWEISQARPEQVPAGDLPPQRLVAAAQERGTPTLAFTYTEPIVFCEYVHDSAKLARSVGVGSAMISNGFIQEAPMRRLCEQLTAVKVDFKGFSDNFYRDVCGGRLDPVLKTLQLCRKIGIHLEIVVLVIPTLNDAPGDLKAMTKWIVDSLGPDVPVHFSRFNPLYRLKNLPATPVATLEQAHKIARDAGINYVYVGNVPMHAANHTYCPKCSTMLIRRLGYVVRENVLTDQGACPKCGTKVPGVFKPKDAFADRKA
jgi:pyruvate formate lyase activating enzyme